MASYCRFHGVSSFIHVKSRVAGIAEFTSHPPYSRQPQTCTSLLTASHVPQITGCGVRPAASRPKGASAPHPLRRFGARIRTWRAWCTRPVDTFTRARDQAGIGTNTTHARMYDTQEHTTHARMHAHTRTHNARTHARTHENMAHDRQDAQQDMRQSTLRTSPSASDKAPLAHCGYCHFTVACCITRATGAARPPKAQPLLQPPLVNISSCNAPPAPPENIPATPSACETAAPHASPPDHAICVRGTV